jgi:hypothetical protein
LNKTDDRIRNRISKSIDEMEKVFIGEVWWCGGEERGEKVSS